MPPAGRWPLRLPVLAVVAGGIVLVAARLPLGPPAWTLEPSPVVGTLPPDEVTRAGDAAERVFRAAVAEIGRAKRRAGLVPDPAAGPGVSPLIGAELTPLVTTLGSLESKRVASSPAWARILVARLSSRGIGRRSLVAAGFSGSFPGLNLAVVAACQALGAELVAVSSVTASTFGASEPGFTWPEIEAHLVRAGLIARASRAVSVGGANDRGDDLDADGLDLARRILDRASASLDAVPLRPASFEEAVTLRLAVYREHARGRPMALYVNTGGTDASLGRSEAVLRLQSGFVTPGRFDDSRDRGVLARVAELGVPVLMLLNVRDLATRWGVPPAEPWTE